MADVPRLLRGRVHRAADRRHANDARQAGGAPALGAHERVRGATSAGFLSMVRTLVTGASGYIGSRLVRELHARGVPVGCVARDPSRVSFDPAVTVYRADMLDPTSLSAIDDGYTTAYYLVHSMGRGGDSDYEQRDAVAASNFARFAIATGIERIVYLCGLGDRPASKHLSSRLHVGEILRDQGPPLTWFRAGMVVGAGSRSEE